MDAKIDIWADDRLDRRADADFLRTHIKAECARRAKLQRPTSYVLNIDAGWGAGKSFFISRLQSQLVKESHLSVLINAWENDFAENPLILVMAEIDRSITSVLPKTPRVKKAWKAVKQNAAPLTVLGLKGLLKRGGSALITSAVVESMDTLLNEPNSSKHAEPVDKDFRKKLESTSDSIATTVEERLTAHSKTAIDDHIQAQKAILNFKASFSQFTQALVEYGYDTPMFIFIDELDRCRPSFAIEMLEKVKHLFDTPNAAFIIATDTKQLTHSISAVYGMGFDSRKYLKRFFDRTFHFETPTMEQYIGHLMAIRPVNLTNLRAPYPQFLKTEKLIVDIFKSSDLELRDVDQVLDILRIICDIWSKKIALELIIILPLIIGHYLHDEFPATYDQSAMKYFADHGLRTPLTINYFNHRSGHTNATLNLAEMAAEYWSKSKLNLVKITQDGDIEGFGAAAYARERISQEWHFRLNGMPVSGSEIINSYISEYPKLIRQAGRVYEIKEVGSWREE